MIPEQPFDEILDFFNEAEQQRAWKRLKSHHDRPALAGVVRELEMQPAVDDFPGIEGPSTDEASATSRGRRCSHHHGAARVEEDRQEGSWRPRQCRQGHENPGAITIPEDWRFGSSARRDTNLSTECRSAR